MKKNVILTILVLFIIILLIIFNKNNFIDRNNINEEKIETFQEYSYSNNEDTYEMKKINASEIITSPELYIGKMTDWKTNSDITSSIKWEILYADNEGIYLIASDYIMNTQVPYTADDLIPESSGTYKIYFENIIDSYSGKDNINNIGKWYKYTEPIVNEVGECYTNAKIADYLLDTNQWKTLYDGENIQWAIGGATLELYKASIKKLAGNDKGKIAFDGYGYKYLHSDEDMINIQKNMKNELYYITSYSNANGAWMVAPCYENENYVFDIYYNGRFDDGNYLYVYGLRPVVSISTSAIIGVEQ